MSSEHGASDGLSGRTSVPVRRVLKAYEQIAEQIKAMIVAGDLVPGERLPNEAVLATDFGVSRATVREALRVLAAQDLIKTAKGGGSPGSYISLPSATQISDLVRVNLNLLTATHDISLDEFLETRELLEVATVRLAATRRKESDLVTLREALPPSPPEISRGEELDLNERFHTVLGESAGNTLLNIAVHTVFTVLHTNLAQHSGLSASVRGTILDEHAEILDAVERGDPDDAEAAMRAHLAFLAPHYRKAWKHVRTSK